MDKDKFLALDTPLDAESAKSCEDRAALEQLRLYLALWLEMDDRGVCALCSYVANASAAPRLAALRVQESGSDPATGAVCCAMLVNLIRIAAPFLNRLRLCAVQLRCECQRCAAARGAARAGERQRPRHRCSSLRHVNQLDPYCSSFSEPASVTRCAATLRMRTQRRGSRRCACRRAAAAPPQVLFALPFDLRRSSLFPRASCLRCAAIWRTQTQAQLAALCVQPSGNRFATRCVPPPCVHLC